MMPGDLIPVVVCKLHGQIFLLTPELYEQQGQDIVMPMVTTFKKAYGFKKIKDDVAFVDSIGSMFGGNTVVVWGGEKKELME
jgi:hypothetical protein